MQTLTPTTAHSPAWVFQVKAAFALAAGGLAWGIALLPIDPWKRGFLGMGALFLVNATFALSKTLRDEHEAKKVHSRLDDARLGRILAEHDPFRDPLTGLSTSMPHGPVPHASNGVAPVGVGPNWKP
jgi:hypothetical protein